jgi:hypothetical protein
MTMQNDQIELTSADANIPLLAIEAANDLDELIEGRQASPNAVRRLAQILRQSFRLDVPGGTRQCFVESGAVAVFSHAVDEVASGPAVSNLQELAVRATEVVIGLEASASGAGVEGLEKMRAFCIALSRAASAYQHSIFEMGPSNPLRR